MLFYDENHLIRVRTIPGADGKYLNEVARACDYNAPEWDEDLEAYRVNSVSYIIGVEGFTIGGVDWPLRDYIMRHVGETYRDPMGEWIIGEYRCRIGENGLYEEIVEVKEPGADFPMSDRAVSVWYYMHKQGKEG